MHNCAIIIKKSDITVEEARETFGEILVNCDHADWYSIDDYRERTFKGAKTITLKEFKENWKEWLEKLEVKEDLSITTAWPFCVIIDGISEYIIPSEYYEFYAYPERRELLEIYNELYIKATIAIIYKLKEEDYDVTLLDYHT